jgi:hypothetical protein
MLQEPWMTANDRANPACPGAKDHPPDFPLTMLQELVIDNKDAFGALTDNTQIFETLTAAER